MPGAPYGSAGTKDTRVDRPEEGLPGLATTTNTTANPPSRATFDAGLAAGGERAGAVAQVDTSAYGITPWAALTRAKPTAWGFGEEAQAFTVANNASNNAAVGTVTFSGDGSSPSFSIVSGNVSKTTPPGTAFAINSSTGAITRTTAGATIVAAEVYTLTVAEEDELGYEDTKTVTITVT